jgi:hypothetical protein
LGVLQSGKIPGLVKRLLLLEAVQQPVAWSFLAPALHGAWQQQQHLDLARAITHGSSSSSDNLQDVWMPQLLTALLQQVDDTKVQDNADVLRKLNALAALGKASTKQQQQQQQQQGSADSLQLTAAGNGGEEERSRVAEAAAASYVLACLSDAACRCSLACWVLTWHGCMLQQGGHYGSVASR